MLNTIFLWKTMWNSAKKPAQNHWAIFPKLSTPHTFFVQQNIILVDNYKLSTFYPNKNSLLFQGTIQEENMAFSTLSTAPTSTTTIIIKERKKI